MMAVQCADPPRPTTGTTPSPSNDEPVLPRPNAVTPPGARQAKPTLIFRRAVCAARSVCKHPTLNRSCDESILDRLDRLPTVTHMAMLQLQQAKQKFCAVAEKAAGGEPQVVTKHGKPFVVIVKVSDWQRTQPRKHSLVERLRACPADLTQLEGGRSLELPRDVGL